MLILNINALIRGVWVGDVFLNFCEGMYWYTASNLRIDTGMTMLPLLANTVAVKPISTEYGIPSNATPANANHPLT